jgi:hypothetical protein
VSPFVQLLLEDHNPMLDHGVNLCGGWQDQNKKKFCHLQTQILASQRYEL